MATLQKIRSKGPLLVGVIALALFAFVAGDAFKVFQPRQPQDVGEINGTALSIAEYQNMVEEFSDVQKSFSGSNSISDAELNQIKDNVWSTYVDNKLVQNEADKIGLTVTPDEVAVVLDQGTDPILRMFPMFSDQETGRFNKELLNDFLENYEQIVNNPNIDPRGLGEYAKIYSFWLFAEKMITQNLLDTKYTALISKGLIANKIEAKNSFDGRTSNATVSAGVFPYSSVNAGVTISEEDLRKEYDANKELFVQNEETRIVKYIDVAITPSQADIDSLDSEVSEYAEMLKAADADYSSIIAMSNSEIPYLDSYLNLEAFPQDIVAHVNNSKVQPGEVFGPITNSVEGTISTFKVIDTKKLPNSYEFRALQISGLAPEALSFRTDSIVKVLTNGGDFSEIAESEGQSDEKRTITEETALSNQMNFLIYNTLSEMKNFEVKTIDLQGGSIVLQCLASSDVKLKHKLVVVKRQMEISEETADLEYNAFSRFVAQNPSMKEMEENAESAGYQVRVVEMNTKMHGVANIPSTKEALRWIFDAKEGNMSNIYDSGSNNDHLLVVSLDRIVKEGYRPMDLVEDNLRNRVLIDKKAELLISQINSSNYKTIDDIKNIENAQVDEIKYVTFNEPAFISLINAKEEVISGFAAGTEVSTYFSKPIKGNYGVYLLSVLDKTQSAESFDADAEMQSIERGYSFIVNRTIKDALLDKTKIVDVRYKFF